VPEPPKGDRMDQPVAVALVDVPRASRAAIGFVVKPPPRR